MILRIGSKDTWMAGGAIFFSLTLMGMEVAHFIHGIGKGSENRTIHAEYGHQGGNSTPQPEMLTKSETIVSTSTSEDGGVVTYTKI